MAILDYGAIAFKNGNLISTGFFTDMKDTCGFTDGDNLLPGTKSSFEGNCFIVIGNREIVIGFYKTAIHWWYNDHLAEPEHQYVSDGEWFGWSEYEHWKRWKNTFYTKSHVTDVCVKPKYGYYVAYINIEQRYTKRVDKYKVYFGYGVDLDFYKKTKRVNYYRSPEFLFGRYVYYPLKNYWKENLKKRK